MALDTYSIAELGHDQLKKHRVLVLDYTHESITLLTDRVITEERRELLETVVGDRTATLLTLQDHPKLWQDFIDTVGPHEMAKSRVDGEDLQLAS